MAATSPGDSGEKTPYNETSLIDGDPTIANRDSSTSQPSSTTIKEDQFNNKVVRKETTCHPQDEEVQAG